MSAPKTEMDRMLPVVPESFDVVCKVGTVELTQDPKAEAPMMAALRLIAEHEADGVYQFTLPYGQHFKITVESELPEREPNNVRLKR